MKKKNIIILILIFFMVIVAGIICVQKLNNSEDLSILNKFYSQHKKDVDAAVEAFMASESFNNLSEDDQIKEMERLLRLYENDGIIKSLHYDNGNKLFSFVYSSGIINGALGGVSLKKWDPMMN